MLLNHFLLVDQKPLSIDHKIVFFFLFLQLEDSIFCKFFVMLHLQMIKQKAYFLLENLDQVSKLNINLIFLLIFFD